MVHPCTMFTHAAFHGGVTLIHWLLRFLRAAMFRKYMSVAEHTELPYASAGRQELAALINFFSSLAYFRGPFNVEYREFLIFTIKSIDRI